MFLVATNLKKSYNYYYYNSRTIYLNVISTEYKHQYDICIWIALCINWVLVDVMNYNWKQMVLGECDSGK